MLKWWGQRAFKLRLTLWYAVVTTVVLTLSALAAYQAVEHRLIAEIDRQLRIDFDLEEARIDADTDGRIHWQVRGAHGDEGFARLSAWFEVWSEAGALLFRHWPVPDDQIGTSLQAPVSDALRFYSAELEDDHHVRLMERPARVQGTGVVMRVFRDETDMRHALHQLVEVFLLALPFALFAASLGGYLLARRSLRPVAEMAAQATRVTSESLSERIQTSNPADEFGQLASVFNDTLARLESSFGELKRFTADASHELRTPLTALRAVGEVALGAEQSITVLRNAIQSMLEESQRLDDLIASLLTLARLEGREVVLRQSQVNLTHLITSVTDSLGVLASERCQRIVVIGGEGIAVFGDPVLLRQALLNIVHNAICYGPEGCPITITSSSAGKTVMIEVADEGPGIDPADQPKVFQRFFRVDQARSHRHGGYGLGLAIARESIVRHGGSLDVESVFGRGSTFRILLRNP